MRRRRRGQKPLSFSMTPMVDVVMLLIIFFMLASKFKGEEAELLSLPFAQRAETAYVQGGPPQFVVNILPAVENGGKAAVYIYRGMRFNPGMPGDMDELRDRLQEFKLLFSNGRVVIRGDRRVYSRYVQRIQAMCLEPGINISKVQYATSAAKAKEGDTR